MCAFIPRPNASEERCLWGTSRFLWVVSSMLELPSGGLKIVCPWVILWSFGEKSPGPDKCLNCNCQPLNWWSTAEPAHCWRLGLEQGHHCYSGCCVHPRCYFELEFLIADFFFVGLEYPQGIEIAVSWCWIEAVLVLDPFNNQLKLSNCSAWLEPLGNSKSSLIQNRLKRQKQHNNKCTLEQNGCTRSAVAFRNPTRRKRHMDL